ncbi:MAG TPA: SCO family protein [Polyangiaceae bacterium]|nr:SCO family protein [Polyangiaceae bacterium]
MSRDESTPTAERSPERSPERPKGSLLSRLAARPATWVAIVVVMFVAPFAAALSRPTPEAPGVFGTLPAYELTDSMGRSFGSATLAGHVYVASFVFTSCPVQCPKLMERMTEVQRRTKNTSGAVHLVTISVDPETDTPERMAEYGERFGARPSRWHLLTGEYQVIEDTVVRGFKLAMGKDADNLFQIFHSEKLVLVDAEGRIRGYYDADDPGLDALMRDIGLVLNLPAPTTQPGLSTSS